MKFRTGFLRGGGALAALVLFFAAGAMAETTNTLSDAEIQGRQLAQQLLEQEPTTNVEQIGILKMRNTKGVSTNLTFKCKITVHSGGWYTRYAVQLAEGGTEWLSFLFNHNSTNSYTLYKCRIGGWDWNCVTGVYLNANEFTPFAGSDFWICDLGLEFFHWPAQKVLPKPTNLVRGRDYTLLESTNPNPSTNGYSRVLTWIDKETGGILQAEAYDASGRLLKEFAPKSFKKVNGQWELQEMEIRNVQTGSRTRLEFDLNKQ
jgi:hypothetical protein